MFHRIVTLINESYSIKAISSSKLVKVASYSNNVDPFFLFFNKIICRHRETVKKVQKLNI